MGLYEKKLANNRFRKNIPDTIIDSITEFFKWDSNKLGGNIPIKIRIIKTTEFNNDYRNSPSKDIIDRIINDIKSGYIYDNSPNNNDWTTYIAKYSNEGRLAYEKRINRDLDRLTYYIEKPVKSKDKDTGRNILLITIRLSGCIGHSFKDSKGNSKTFSILSTNPIKLRIKRILK